MTFITVTVKQYGYEDQRCLVDIAKIESLAEISHYRHVPATYHKEGKEFVLKVAEQHLQTPGCRLTLDSKQHLDLNQTVEEVLELMRNAKGIND